MWRRLDPTTQQCFRTRKRRRSNFSSSIREGQPGQEAQVDAMQSQLTAMVQMPFLEGGIKDTEGSIASIYSRRWCS